MQEQEPVVFNGGQSREEFRVKDLSYQRFLQLEKKYLGSWGAQQVKIKPPPARQIPVEQKKQQVEEPKPQKKKRKDEFVICQRFLKNESSTSPNKPSNKILRKYNDKYFEYIESLRQNDFSVFDRAEYQSLVQEQSSNTRSKVKPIKQQSQTKSKRPKKKQMYMPTVVSTIKKASHTNEDQDKSARKELNTQRIQMKIKKLKQKLRQLQIQINQDDISQKECKKLNKERDYVYGYKKHLEGLLTSRKQKQLQQAKRAHLENLEKTIKANTMTSTTSTITSNKPQTQYQNYMKEKNDKNARKEQLLLQEELRAQKQKQFEERIKKSVNPLHAVSQMQDEMIRNGNKLLQNLMKKAGIRGNIKSKNKNRNRQRQQTQKQESEQTQMQTKFQKQKQKQRFKQKLKQVKAQKTDRADKSYKNLKQETKNRHRKEQFLYEESINSGSSLPKWKRELMDLTGYDPSSQKYRDRDREEIHQSGFSRIEKQDKYSRRMARRQQKQAEAQGQIEDI